MLATWQLELSLQIALVAVPIALYFLILGLLNSQNRPQVLTGQVDFALLLAALSPLVLVPVLNWVGVSLGSIAAAGAGLAGIIYLISPRRDTGWVVYNIRRTQALQAVERALRGLAVPYEIRNEQLHLPGGAVLRLTAFPLLRNVSLTIRSPKGVSASTLHGFTDELRRHMGRYETVASPMAVSFVLISTAIIVAPLAMMANRMPEMVRLIGDMIG